MPLTTIAFNGTPVEDLGFSAAALSGWLDIAERTYDAVDLLGHPGQRVVANTARFQPRAYNLTLYLSPSSLADRRTKLDTLFAAFPGVVALTTIEDSTRQCFGYLRRATTTPASRPFLAGQPQVGVACEFVCYDPLWYDVTPQAMTLSTPGTAYTIPVGNARSRRIVITISGAATPSPTVLTLKNSGGTTLQTMTLNSTLAGGESWVVDCYNGTITKSGASVLSILGTTDTFLEIDPTTAPTLTVSRGTATASVTRAWHT